MRRILSLILILFSTFILLGCNVNSKPNVVSYEVSEYDSEVSYLKRYNEDSVLVDVTFDNGTTKKYSGLDLSFNYDEFSTSIFGEQTIGITVDELNIDLEITVDVVESKSFKLLMVGNSYSDDTAQWVHEICDSLGIEAVVGNLYIGGCSLDTHYDNLVNDYNRYEFRVYSETSKGWITRRNTSISEAMEYEDWEFVSLQQASGFSGKPTSYSNLDNIMDEIEFLNEEVVFIWNMTWAYQQDIPHGQFGNYNNNQMTMYNAIVDTVKSKVLTNDRIATVIPNGTAIQNVRTSKIGDTLCRDEYCHLSYNYGRYIAGLTLVSAITGKVISNIDYAPVNVTSEQKEIALESVKNAMKKPYEITDSTYKEVDKTIDILMIANSYGDDTVQWVHEIANDLGVDINIANLYIGGCTLSTHLTNLNGNLAKYEYVSYNKTTKTWSRQANTSIATALGYRDWDYVSLQQGSHESGLANSYDIIDTIMDKVLSIKNDVKFIWNMTWAYQQNSGHSNFGNYNNDQMTMYNAIVNAVKTKVIPNERIEFVVPNGTAVQNARTSYIGDNLCRDVYCHLTYDFGRYIAGLTMLAKVTGLDISNITYSPNLSSYNRKIAIESVKNALANPYAVTNSKYTEKETINLNDYVKIDWQPTLNSYWHSTEQTILVNWGNLASNFISSKLFTKAELPIGTIIEIKEGYQYRPDGYITQGILLSGVARPNNVSTQYVEITEAWWGSFNYRGFNISSKAGGSLSGKTDQAIAAFNIYVPKNAK